MSSGNAVEIRGLTFRYGDRLALDAVDLDVPRNGIFGLLGPNGSGKTTLFRILCTLLPVQGGGVSILGHDVSQSPQEVRKQIGITFQSPSLDGKLTVWENLRHQSHLYGLRGREMKSRIDELLDRYDLSERRNDLVDELSGGLKRRTELAKGLLHQPQLLLLDEPSTGLDPAARLDLWKHLEQVVDNGMTVLLTTHLMDEASRCSRVAIMNRGELVVEGPPDDLRSELGGDGVTLHARQPEELESQISSRFDFPVRRIGSSIRVELDGRRERLGELLDAFAGEIRSMEFGKPTLEDVFIARTGHRFEEGDPA